MILCGEAWIRSVFKYRNRYPLEKANHLEYVDKWNNGEYEYLVFFENSRTYKAIKNEITTEGAEQIFSTQTTKLYKK